MGLNFFKHNYRAFVAVFGNYFLILFVRLVLFFMICIMFSTPISMR